jgi:hypothetical protein
MFCRYFVFVYIYRCPPRLLLEEELPPLLPLDDDELLLPLLDEPDE